MIAVKFISDWPGRRFNSGSFLGTAKIADSWLGSSRLDIWLGMRNIKSLCLGRRYIGFRWRGSQRWIRQSIIPFTLLGNTSITIMSDGTNWRIV